jgi:histidine phosphotransferase ChpT
MATEIAALIASRICHDLISPIGAIGNGMELMALSSGQEQSSPELDLISQSVENANARIRFFRIAYG